MVKYIIKRVILFPVILIVVSMLIYWLVNLTKVDPATTLLPSSATQEDRDALHERLGLNYSLPRQYFNYMAKAITGDFGTSWYTSRSVWGEIKPKIPVTAKLAIMTTIVVVLIALPLGVLCAVKQFSFWDYLINALAKVCASLPAFWLALILMLFFSVKLKLTPLYGLTSWKSWILPIASLSLESISSYIRQSRSAMLDSVRQDFVRTARSKGCKESTVIFKHSLRNAALILVTMAGQLFASLMGGALVIEQVFALPGLGTCVIHAITVKDVPLVVGATLFISIIFLCVNLVLDMLYVVVDPRVKATFVSAKRVKKVKEVKAVEGKVA